MFACVLSQRLSPKFEWYTVAARDPYFCRRSLSESISVVFQMFGEDEHHYEEINPPISFAVTALVPPDVVGLVDRPSVSRQ